MNRRGFNSLGEARDLVSLGEARKVNSLGRAREFVSLGEARELNSLGGARELISLGETRELNSLGGAKKLVTPRSCGYGEITTTYIHGAGIPSPIYFEHHYSTGVRVRKFVILYILTKYKYSVITDYDLILHQCHITKRCKSMIYKI